MKADEAMSQVNTSSTTGKEAVMDTAPAVNVAVEVKLQSPPKDPSGEEATMVATPAVDAVEAQSLSHPKDPSGKEPDMVAESRVVTPSSPSTPSESPDKGGSGTKKAKRRHSMTPRELVEDHDAIALRLDREDFRSRGATAFKICVREAAKAYAKLNARLFDRSESVALLSVASVKLARAIERLRAVFQYDGTPLAPLMSAARVTMLELQITSYSGRVGSVRRLAGLLLQPATTVSTEVRDEAREMMKAANELSLLLDKRAVIERELTGLRTAFEEAIGKSRRAKSMLAEELRFADWNDGTTLLSAIMPAVARARSRVNQMPDQNAPAQLKLPKGSTG